MKNDAKRKTKWRPLNLFSSFPLRYTVLIPMILWILLSSILLSSVLIKTSQITLEEESVKYIRNSHSEAGKQINILLHELTLFTSTLLMDTKIHNIISTSSTQSDQAEVLLYEQLQSIPYNKDFISQITFVADDSSLVHYKPSSIILPIPNNLQIENYLSDNFLWKWGDLVLDSNHNAYLPYVVKFYNNSLQSDTGCVIIYLNEKIIRDTYAKLSSPGSVSYILTDKQEVISHIDSNYLNFKYMDKISNTDEHLSFHSKSIIENSHSIVVGKTDLDKYLKKFKLNWSLYTEIPESIIFEEINRVRHNIILITSITLIFLIIIIFTYTKKLSSSFIMFNQKIQEYIKSGIHEYFSVDNSRNEIIELENAYDSLILRIEGLIERNNQEKEIQRILELNALQAQINPHFLYNTLDAVSWIAKMKDQYEIEQIVLALSNYFRLSLHNGDKYATVEEEMDMIKNYIFIEQIRFPDKINISFDLDEDLLDIPILKLIFQPFIENSIKHGISLIDEVGLIKIIGTFHQTYIEFIIEDNGIGCDDPSKFFKPSKTATGGYGIINVKERLNIEYGSNAKIEVKSELNIGTTIKLHIPIH